MPVTGKKKVLLTIDNILNRISEYDIYRFYIGSEIVLGRSMMSPFRKEENPSFSVMVTKGGTLHHTDFADTSKRGGCIDFVIQLHNLPDYRSALQKIDRDFGLGISHSEVKDYKKIVGSYTQPVQASKRYAFIQVVTRRFDTAELKYWKDYHITEAELKENDVYSIKKLYLNRKLYPLPDTELRFAYLFEDKWKIYRPYASKKEKWMTNVPNERMSGMERITKGCGNAVVTKAKKDELVLAKFLPHVCSVQSESTISINTENVKLLQQNCGKIYLNFDSDEVGVQSCKYYNQFGFLWVNCPKGFKTPEGKTIKDFADLAKYHGLEIVINYFKLKGII